MARKILLADDSVTAQNMGRKILADAGYEVITVNNGSAALKKISEAKPDVIVLDVYMPGYSGLEVCQRLKETGDTSRIPILLTVGKLEPFKPEEAKRARADAFIVKPFEASELLSALTKLEDKIVPRAESSKPGRFARTIAIVEEGRYDSTMAAQEDSSWKNRIAFPSRKKKSADAGDVDDPAIYNPVNKDLRTTIERKPAEQSTEDTTIDVGALAEHGLPKDVTPEEIAALAAAAAQIKGTMAGEQGSDAGAEPKTEDVAQAAQPEIQAQEKTEEKIEARAEEKKIEEVKPEEVKSDEGKTEKIEVRAADVSDAPASIVAKAFEVLQRFAEKPRASVSEPVPAESSMAAYATSAEAESSSFASPAHNGAEEPVTMAVAAGADHIASSPRWAAVSVALLPEESAVSLEQEMQKAYAASMPPAPVIIPQPETSAIEAPAGDSSLTGAFPIFATATAPVVEAGSVDSAAVRQAEAELAEFTTSPAADMQTPQSEAASSSAPVAEAPSADFAAAKESDGKAEVWQEARQDATQEASAVVLSAPEPAVVPAEQPAPVAETHSAASGEIASVVTAGEDRRSDAIQSESRSFGTQNDGSATEPAPEVYPQVDAVASAPVHAVASEAPEATTGPTQAALAATDQAENQAVPEAAASESRSAEAPAHPAVQKESEIAATTAAAWATWRRIRETSDTKAASSSEPTEDKTGSRPQNEAAMAVAAGAERAPEESNPASNSDSADSDTGDIANIVDSVLADLRPKIVAEISKKMGKKK